MKNAFALGLLVCSAGILFSGTTHDCRAQETTPHENNNDSLPFEAFAPLKPIQPRGSTDSHTADPAAERISSVLQDANASPQAPGLLGDVLDIIRERGSVLDGSVLDPKLDPALNAPTEHNPIAFDQQNEKASGLSSSSSQTDQRFIAAESLLRAARKLETLPSPSTRQSRDQRSQLIQHMRMEASAILTAIFHPHPTDPLETFLP
ncbi:hypothetical protein [Neorhodopirellula lusitana]|uniref:hypothetical protein n=1 Tax=Neorhodopirellula lusitana TaxID=445327 RepID=UPI00384B470C